MLTVESGQKTSYSLTDFRKILTEFKDRVYNQAYRMLGNPEDAEEAAQDIFLKIYRSIGDFRGDCKVSTWIYSITSNECITRLRKKQLDTVSLDKTFDSDEFDLGDIIPDSGLSPEEHLDSKDTAEFIRSRIRSLPAKWAMALSLFHFDDLSYDEISEIMKLPKATVATYILRGRRQLAKWLVDYV